MYGLRMQAMCGNRQKPLGPYAEPVNDQVQPCLTATDTITYHVGLPAAPMIGIGSRGEGLSTAPLLCLLGTLTTSGQTIGMLTSQIYYATNHHTLLVSV